MEHDTHTTIADKVIQRLEDDKVTPIARWHFALKNSGFWSLWLLSVVLGSCAAAATIFTFLNSGWKYRTLTHDSFFLFLLDVMPLFWLISLGMLIVGGYYTLRNTSRGYRFPFFMVILASIVVSGIGGTLLYSVGVAGTIDTIRRPLPFSHPILSLEEDRWNNMTKGLVAGVVQSFDAKEHLLTLALFSGEEKILSTIELDPLHISMLTEGARVRIIGGVDIDSSNVFVACVVVPWNISGVRPPPLARNGIRSERIPFVDERNTKLRRNSICKDVRPYQQYKATVITN
jgi:hypothetical protein